MVLWATGQRFSTCLDIAWRLIPVESCAPIPAEVSHLHIQPPLWNLLIGGVLAGPLPDAISRESCSSHESCVACSHRGLFARPASASCRHASLDPRCWPNVHPTYDCDDVA